MKTQQWFLHHSPRVWSHRPPLASPNFSSNIHHNRHFRSSTAPRHYQPLQVLEDGDIDQFRKNFFIPERPILLPRQHFRHLPAVERWFPPSVLTANTRQLNITYLAQHGANALVPLELTQVPQDSPIQLSFRQFHAPLNLFLEWIRTAATQPQSTRLYLAQCQLLDLPEVLRDDFPTPEIVARAGKGDIYDTNVWIGHPPTYTPLHRDPNPNLFVQLSGRKVVRLLAPNKGQGVFSSVRQKLGRRGDREAAAFRGVEMMQGEEKAFLEQAVWNGDASTELGVYEGYEAHLEAGDGLFIPKGWWHSIKGVGEGVTGSVNWWFR